MKIIYSKQAAKSLERIDAPTRQRIRNAIAGIPGGDIKQLQGHTALYRLRVGSWRVVFSYPDDETILIERVSPRGGAYKGV